MKSFNLEDCVIETILEYKFMNLPINKADSKNSIFYNCYSNSLMPDTYIKRKIRSNFRFMQSENSSEDIDVILKRFVKKQQLVPSYINASGRSTNTIQGYRLENFRGWKNE